MIFCFVRETKQLTLEELDRKFGTFFFFFFWLFQFSGAIHPPLPLFSSNEQSLPLTSFAEVFSVPTKQFISYELKVWLPYFIKRHIFRRNIPKPPPIIEKESKEDSE